MSSEFGSWILLNSLCYGNLITLIRSSGSGMKYPSCASPEFFLVPEFGTNCYSTRSHDRPGRTPQTRIFCGKALFLHLQEKRARSKRARSKRERKAREREKRNPFYFKENNHCLGRITPWLAAAHGRADVHGKNRVQVVVNTLGSCADYLFTNLEHRMSAPSCDGECGGGFPQFPLFLLIRANRPPILMRVEIEVKSPVCR